MAIPSKAAVTGGVTENGWYPDLSRRSVLRERVQNTSTNNIVFMKTAQQLPPNCKVLYAEVMNATALNVSGNDGSSTADRVALVFATSDAALTNLATNSALTSVAIGSAGSTVASNTISRFNVPQLASQVVSSYVNTTTVAGNVYLVPVATQTAIFRIGSVATTTVTCSYVFSGTQSIDVLVYYEAFGDLQTA